MDWSKQILDGITKEIPINGNPTKLVVYGESAQPILTGANEADILIAAGTLGEGRVVVISGNAYVSNMCSTPPKCHTNQEISILQENIKNWVTKGCYDDEKCIVSASVTLNSSQLEQYKIIIWDGKKSNINSDDVAEFVKKGGGFVYAPTVWAWISRSKKELVDIPYLDILSSVGIALRNEDMGLCEGGFCVKGNKSSEAHLRMFLKKNNANLKKLAEKFQLLAGLRWISETGGNDLWDLVDPVWRLCDKFVKSHIPSEQNKVKGTENVVIYEIWRMIANMKNMMIKAPGVEEFPGDFPSSSTPLQLTTKTFQFKSERGNMFVTGCYAPAGRPIQVEVLSGNEEKKWVITIGAHQDSLVKVDSGISRWPVIVTSQNLQQNRYTMWSPFGGIIHLQSPVYNKSSISIRISDVVLTPVFDLTDETHGKTAWKTNRMLPGLWADISGRYMTFTLPSRSIRNIEDPTEVMQGWDRLICLYHELRGTDVNEYQRMYLVTDAQPSYGYMHAGYPIETHMDVADPTNPKYFLLDTGIMKRGGWPLFHEIGHNMQKTSWTFEGTIEVTVNIFTLYASDVICGQKPWLHPWLESAKANALTYLKIGAKFEDWKKSAGTALFIYAQLIHEFGWDAFKEIFRFYEGLPVEDVPRTNQAKIDRWFVTFSKTVGFNLAPLTMFWGIPLSKFALEELKKSEKLKPFFPDDEITQTAAHRTAEVLMHFPTSVRNSRGKNQEIIPTGGKNSCGRDQKHIPANARKSHGRHQKNEL